MWGQAIVRGDSMLPTLHAGDRLLVHYGRPPRLGSLVVVRLPDSTVAVKRAVARDWDGWWVERDNAERGVDSWSVGAIRDDDILAVVRCRLWPPLRSRHVRRLRRAPGTR